MALKQKCVQGHIPWTFSEIEQYRAFWPYGTEQRLAFELQFWAGSRISDTVGLGPSNITDDGWLEFTQIKTGSEVSVPFYRALPHFAVEADLGHVLCAIEAIGPRESTFMLTEYGRPRSQKAASQWFSKMAKNAGLADKRTSHGLRKSRMILHAENGASIHQIAAWSGHETLKEIERYTRKANRKRILTPSALETGDFL